MEKIKKITINLKPYHILWMSSGLFFIMSYAMAATAPGVDTALNVFHIAFMVLFAIGSVGTAIAGFINLSEGD